MTEADGKEAKAEEEEGEGPRRGRKAEDEKFQEEEEVGSDGMTIEAVGGTTWRGTTCRVVSWTERKFVRRRPH